MGHWNLLATWVETLYLIRSEVSSTNTGVRLSGGLAID